MIIVFREIYLNLPYEFMYLSTFCFTENVTDVKNSLLIRMQKLDGIVVYKINHSHKTDLHIE